MSDDPFMTAEESDEPPIIMASYDGRCTSCGEDILADLDEIQADGQGGWRHTECL